MNSDPQASPRRDNSSTWSSLRIFYRPWRGHLICSYRPWSPQSSPALKRRRIRHQLQSPLNYNTHGSKVDLYKLWKKENLRKKSISLVLHYRHIHSLPEQFWIIIRRHFKLIRILYIDDLLVFGLGYKTFHISITLLCFIKNYKKGINYFREEEKS